jgi:hypothetical protein
VTTRERLTAAFIEYDRQNPHVYARLRELALQAKATGRPKLGIGMLFEVLRWEHYLATAGDEFKLNNNYRSRYARLLMHREPTLVGFFDVRELS